VWQSTKTIVKDIRNVQKDINQELETLQATQNQRYQSITESLFEIESNLNAQEKKQESFQKESLNQIATILQCINEIGQKTNETIFSSSSALQNVINKKFDYTNETLGHFINTNAENIMDAKQKINKIIPEVHQGIVASYKEQREKTKLNIDKVSEQIIVLIDNIEKYNKSVDDKTSDISTSMKKTNENLALLDEGTRLIIANMLLAGMEN